MMRKCCWTVRVSNEKRIEKFGYFHQWGTNVGFNPDGEGVNYTEAIVEDKDGCTMFVPVDSIQFMPNDISRKEYDDHEIAFGF